jgi:SulP family sulfate permease
MSTAAAQVKVPATAQLPKELLGGLAAMLVALPSAIAYGVTSFAALGSEYVAHGALAGILGTVALGLVAPLLGGAPRLITAPCAPAAAVMAALAVQFASPANGAAGGVSPQQVLLLMTLVALMSGLLQILYGAIGGGRLIKYIPYPVVSGYLSGVGMLILIGQLPKLFGLPKGVPVLVGLFDPGQWRWQGLVVGCVTMTMMLAGPKLTKVVPATILGLAAGMLTYFGLGFFCPELLHLEHNKLVIGPIGAGAGGVLAGVGERWRGLSGLSLAGLQPLLMPALTLSVLLSIDTLKTCVVMDALTRARHKSNRELLAQGLGNVASALVGGMPGAGTMGATLVNLNSGGQTRLSGFCEGVLALAAFLAFSGLVAWVPIGALAGILLVVALRMLDRGSLHLLRQWSTVLDFGVILAVVVVAIQVNLIAAAAVGLGLAILLYIREQMRGSVIRRKVYGSQISSKRQRLPHEKEILLASGKTTAVCELQGSLFFGTTDRLFTELEQDLKVSRYVVLDLRRVQSVDYTAAHMLQLIQAMLEERNAHLAFSNLPAAVPSGQDLARYFAQLGLLKSTGDVKLFDNLDDALEWAEDLILEEAGYEGRDENTPLNLTEIELFREFEADQTLPALQACVEQRSYQPGETIFRRGDSGDELMIIRLGMVRIVLPLANGKHYNLAIFGRGSFFGDMGFLDPGARSADAVAVTRTNLYVLSRRQFNQVVQAHPLVGVKMFARLARVLAIRLRHTDNELRALHDS